MIIKPDTESQSSNDRTDADTPTHTSNTVPGPGPGWRWVSWLNAIIAGIIAVFTYFMLKQGSFSVEQGLEKQGNFSVEQGLESVPWPHRSFMIRNRASDRILARENGSLVLKEAVDLAPCGWRWTCVEHPEGWLGFRETSSGTYLGRDNHGGFQAWATEHRGWEQFDARRHPDGGYQLLSICWWNRQRMAVEMETQRVVEIAGPGDTLGAAARWDFVQIE